MGEINLDEAEIKKGIVKFYPFKVCKIFYELGSKRALNFRAF
jgi:hypothetical protein